MSLTEEFWRAAPPTWRTARAGAEELESRLEPRLAATLGEAKAAWPEVDLAPELYVAHVARHLPASQPDREPDVLASLDALATSDLYLAAACAQGDEAAMRCFQQTYGDAIRAVVGRSAPAAVDDITQRLLGSLLTGDSPSIATFAGRSSLRSWLRVVATRATYAHAKRERRHRGDDLDAIADQIDAGVDDPELERLKSTYRVEFKKGFARAFGKLTVRQRNMFRHEHLDGLGVNELADLYGVHRGTVSRWRATARAKLLEETRRYFRDVVEIAVEDFDSIFRLIDSQLDVSLTRLLREDPHQESG